MTFYDILGVPHDATQAEIRSAYRELARQYHPDGQQGSDVEAIAQAEEITKALNAAFNTLSNPVRRRAYTHVMYTRLDPARQYKFRPPGPVFRGPGTRNGKSTNGAYTNGRATSANSILAEIKQTRQELEQMLAQQQVKRRNFWMSAAFTSLLIYFLMALGLQLFPSSYDLLPIMIFFVGGELISQAIIMHAGGMQLDRFPFRGNPVTFSLTIFLGTLLSSVSISKHGLLLSKPTGLFFGLVMSLVLLVHLFLVTRMGKLQDSIFSTEIRHLDEHLENLEQKLRELKNKNFF